VEFLLSRFRDAGIAIGAAEADAILSASDNIPYYLQAIASLTFEEAASEGRGEVRASDVETAIETFVGVNAELYEERLRNLSAAKRAIVDALASERVAVFDEAYRARHGLPVSSTLHTALKDLVDDGFVETDAHGYHLADPMLVRYVRQASARLFVCPAQSPAGI